MNILRKLLSMEKCISNCLTLGVIIAHANSAQTHKIVMLLLWTRSQWDEYSINDRILLSFVSTP